MVKQVVGALFTLDEANNVLGVKDPDGDEHVLVFEGEPTNSVAFDTTPDTSRALGVGELRWNATDGTLEFVLKGGLVTLQIGQEQVVRMRNTGTSDIADGAVVYASGATGAFLTVELAKADTHLTSELTFGIATEAIVKNTEGFVTTFGLVRNIDTSALDEGAPVYLSATVAGGMTSTRPAAPNHAAVVGYCLRSHPTLGVVFVKVQNGNELEDLHNVKITNPQDGQVLKYQASTGLWINSAP